MADKVNFNSILMKDSKQKIVFLIFYTAIIYHLAKLMKTLGLKVPSNIAFSGNGSKVISVLSPNEASLEKLTKVIFELIYHEDVSRINLIVNKENPKEATCKGGLFLANEPINIKEAKAVLLAGDLIVDQTYKDAADLYEKVVEEVKSFSNFLVLKLPREVSLNGDFGIDPSVLSLVRDCFNENLYTFIEKGVNSKIASGEVGLEDKIEETLFFYPIIGVMNSLSDKICG